MSHRGFRSDTKLAPSQDLSVFIQVKVIGNNPVSCGAGIEEINLITMENREQYSFLEGRDGCNVP